MTNILMIGNSFCYYYADELCGMAKAIGTDMRVCNVYASGCELKKHWTWWKSGEANYQEFDSTDSDGRTVEKNVSLEYCLNQHEWDVISLQETSRCVHFHTAWQAVETSRPYFTELTDYLRERFPRARFLWHHTWAYQVGYAEGGYVMNDAAEQSAYAQRAHDFSVAVCRELGVERVNSGDAWQIARANPIIGDTLCARAGINGGLGDNQHDGDTGGGQYLNACVWFEVITGLSCVGNSFRPPYGLPEEKIAALQQAAHEAVAGRE